MVATDLTAFREARKIEDRILTEVALLDSNMTPKMLTGGGFVRKTMTFDLAFDLPQGRSAEVLVIWGHRALMCSFSSRDLDLLYAPIILPRVALFAELETHWSYMIEHCDINHPLPQATLDKMKAMGSALAATRMTRK